MSPEQRWELRRLEGSSVSLALTDGSRIDDVNLVSARSVTLWIFDRGDDVFVPMDRVIDFWPSESVGSAA